MVPATAKEVEAKAPVSLIDLLCPIERPVAVKADDTVVYAQNHRWERLAAEQRICVYCGFEASMSEVRKFAKDKEREAKLEASEGK